MQQYLPKLCSNGKASSFSYSQSRAKMCKLKICSAKVQLYYNVIIRIYVTSVPSTQPYNRIIYPGVSKIYLVFFWKCLLYLCHSVLLLLVSLYSCPVKDLVLLISNSKLTDSSYCLENILYMVLLYMAIV